MTFLNIVGESFCVRLVLILAHFLWQATAITLIFLLAGLFLRKSSAQLRYLLAVIALLLMLACPFITFSFVKAPSSALADFATVTSRNLEDENPHESQLSQSEPAISHAASGIASETITDSGEVATPLTKADNLVEKPAGEFIDSVTSFVSRNAGYLTVGYFVCVFVMLARLLVGIHGGRRLRKASETVLDSSLLSTLGQKAELLGMRFAPAIAYCKRVAVPTVIGVVKPMILLPISFASGLSAGQVEAILTHELAHIRRYDHFVNLLQRIVEALLFFHPAVWFVSRKIRIEREHCCDDMVVKSCGRYSYAESLVRVAELNLSQRVNRLSTVAALAAADTKKTSQLRTRVLRIIGSEHEKIRLHKSWPIMTVLIAAAILSTALLVSASAKPNKTDTEIKPAGEKIENPLKVLDVEFQPISQGKNVVHIKVQNVSQSEQMFGIHIYTRSPSYSQRGMGWGKPFLSTLKPAETETFRYVFKMQGPPNDKTWIRLRFYNPDSQETYNYEKYFLERKYESEDLEHREFLPKSEIQLEIIKVFKGIQSDIRNKNYKKAWDSFTLDYQQAEFQGGLEGFINAMEGKPGLKWFIWNKNEFLELEVESITHTGNGRVPGFILLASRPEQIWKINFVREEGQLKIDWIHGYTPEIIKKEKLTPKTTAVPPIIPQLTENKDIDPAWELLPGASFPTDGDWTFEESDYIVGPDDILDIAIRDLYQEGLETTLRRQVSRTGYIDLPKLPEKIEVAGLIQDEVTSAIIEAYKVPDIISKPNVLVTITAKRQDKFSILGAVNKPDTYNIIPPDMRLLEALSLAGGITQTNIRYIYVIRPAEKEADATKPRIIAINFDKLNAGDPRMNIVIRHNDIVRVPFLKHSEFYVIGEVKRPGTYSLTGRSVTVKMALAAAGYDPTKTEVHTILIRHRSDGVEERLPLDLRGILEGTEPDVYLRPDDVLLVQLSEEAKKIKLLGNDQKLQSLRMSESKLQTLLDKEKPKFGPKHRKVLEIETQLKSIREQINQREKELLGKGYSEYRASGIYTTAGTAKQDGPKPPTGPVQELKFARLVLGKDKMTFEGQETTWDELPKIFEKFPDKENTVLQVAVTDDEAVSTKTLMRALNLVSHGFKGGSYTGVHPLGTKGDPPTTIPVEKAKPSTQIPKQTPPASKIDPIEAVEKAVRTISTCAEGDPRISKAMDSLKGLDQQAVVEKLTEYLDSDKPTIRRSAIYILWRSEFDSIESAVKPLIKLTSHDEVFTRGMAALALGSNKVEQSLDTLSKMTLEDSDPYARRCAAYALGQLGNPRAINVLEKSLKDENSLVRQNSEAALTMIREGWEPSGAVKEIYPGVKRRYIGKKVAQFPQPQDLSTPESACAAYKKASGLEGAERIVDLSWVQLNPDEVRKFWERAKKEDPENIYLNAVKGSYIIEVLTYKADYASVISYLPFSPGTGKSPYSRRSFGRINGQWKNLGEDRLPSLEAARESFNRKKERLYEHFDGIKKAHQISQPGAMRADQFPEIVGCRIRKYHHQHLARISGDLKPAFTSLTMYEHSKLAFSWEISSQLETEVTYYGISVAPAGSNINDVDQHFYSAIGIPADVNKAEYGQDFPGTIGRAARHLTPGQYDVYFLAYAGEFIRGKGRQPIAGGKLSLTVSPLPLTQIQIADIQPDGVIKFQSVIQSSNLSGKEIASTGFINSDFVKVESMADDAGKPLKFTAKHEGRIFRYNVIFNEPIKADEPILYSSKGTMTSLVKQTSPGEFTYRMRHWPATGRDTHRLEIFRLPKGAKLLKVYPDNLPQRSKDGRTELVVDRIIEPNGSLEVVISYKLEDKPAKAEGSDSKQVYIVTFQPVGDFQPTTAKELLGAFNEKHPKGVRTHHYRTQVQEGKLVGHICVDGASGKEALENMLKQSKKLELIDATAADEEKLKALYKMGQPSLKSDGKMVPTFIVKGIVTDAETGQPITGVKVGDHRYGDGKLFGITGPDGSYSYKTWYEEHTIKAEATGYKTKHEGLYTKLLGSEKEKIINFALVSESKSLAPEDEKLTGQTVNEGVGFGEVVLGLTVQQVLDVLGPPDKRTDDPHTWLQYRKSLGIDIIFPGGKAGEIRFNKGFVHPLSRGPRIGSTMEEVFQVYGKPIKTVKTTHDKVTEFDDRILCQLAESKASKIEYAYQGILFWFDKDNKVHQFVAFKPDKPTTQPKVDSLDDASSEKSDVPQEFVGHWKGQAFTGMTWLKQQYMPVDIEIKPDGSVIGTVGDALLVDARFQRKSKLITTLFKHNTLYEINAKLRGPIVIAEDIKRDSIWLGLTPVIDNSKIEGGFHTSGLHVGGKNSMVLTGGDMVLTSTKPAAHPAEGNRIVDKIDYPFVNDTVVIGKWESVDFVNQIDDFDPASKRFRGELFLTELIFLEGGKTPKPFWTWTKGLLLHHGDKTASKYVIQEIDGKTYMFLEWKSGDYTIRHMKPKYYVLKKATPQPKADSLEDASSEKPDVPHEFAGSWQGQTQIIVTWCKQKQLPIAINIAPDGSVTGTVGDAELKNAVFERKPAFYTKLMKHKKKYWIRGDLVGPIVKHEGIKRKSVTILMTDIEDGKIKGSLATSGTHVGGKKTMVLSTIDMALTKTPATQPTRPK